MTTEKLIEERMKSLDKDLEKHPEISLNRYAAVKGVMDKTEKNGLILKVNGVTGYFPKEFIVEAIETHLSVVRCKDCYKHKNGGIGCPFFDGINRDENDYCSYGAR